MVFKGCDASGKCGTIKGLLTVSADVTPRIEILHLFPLNAGHVRLE